MTIIVVANSKGGVGKSTTSVHLAAWLSEQGHRVLLADCDSQQSSSGWLREACSDIDSMQFEGADEILDNLPSHAEEYDYVVADGPGSQTDTSRALLLIADFAIIPCKASMLEVRALAEATKVLRHARNVRDGNPPATIILSMVGKNYRLTSDMRDAAAALHLPITKTPWVLRQIYADAPGQGAVVWKMGARARTAADEVRQIFAEILPQAKAKRRRKKTKTRAA